MLVVERKKTEAVIVEDVLTGERIRLSVQDIRGNKARIGIDAVKSRYRILREELIPSDLQGFVPAPHLEAATA